jgi:integrase
MEDLMAKKNHHLLKRGDIWYLQAKVNGKRVRQALSLDVTEARTLRDELMEELRWGRMVPGKKERPVFGEIAKRWIRLEEKRLRPSTLRDYRSAMNFHVLPEFGNRFMDEIRPVDIEEFLLALECGAKRANNILVPLRSLFRFAKKNGFIEWNIMLDVENLPVEKPEIKPLSMGEVTAMLNAVNPHYRNFFIVAFFTGMRLGEQLALKWKHIDWERKKISVCESKVMGIEGRPKTKGSYREVDILPVVEEALREERRKTGLRSPYVFLNTDGDPVKGKSVSEWTWTNALKKAGLEYRSMYHTRHTFATLMLSSGENMGWVQRMLGHTSLRMIQERYFRYIPNLTHADGSAFQEKFRNALEKVTPKLPQAEKQEIAG